MHLTSFFNTLGKKCDTGHKVFGNVRQEIDAIEKKLWPRETNMLFWPQNSQHCEKKFESTQTFYDTVK